MGACAQGPHLSARRIVEARFVTGFGPTRWDGDRSAGAIRAAGPVSGAAVLIPGYTAPIISAQSCPSGIVVNQFCPRFTVGIAPLSSKPFARRNFHVDRAIVGVAVAHDPRWRAPDLIVGLEQERKDDQRKHGMIPVCGANAGGACFDAPCELRVS